MRFFDMNDGVVVSAVSALPLQVTRDGGRTCSPRTLPVSPGTFSSISTAGAQTVWLVCVDGSVQRSDDRGDIWRAVATGLTLDPGARWTAVHFIDVNNGWLAGTAGHAAVTTDGGRTWRAQRTRLQGAVTQIQFVDRRTGWLLGADGIAMGTGTGTGGN